MYDDKDNEDDNNKSVHVCVAFFREERRTVTVTTTKRDAHLCVHVIFLVQLVVRVFRVCCVWLAEKAGGRKERQRRKQVIGTSCSSCVRACVHACATFINGMWVHRYARVESLSSWARIKGLPKSHRELGN